jgi:hypothetical protein
MAAPVSKPISVKVRPTLPALGGGQDHPARRPRLN